MSYVNKYELRHDHVNYMSIFLNHLNQMIFSQYIRMNLRHQKYKIEIIAAFLYSVSFNIIYTKNHKKNMVG